MTTEGLLIYSLDTGITFDPFDLSEDINPDAIELALNSAHYSNAVMMSFKLNEKQLITRSLEAVPPADSKRWLLRDGCYEMVAVQMHSNQVV